MFGTKNTDYEQRIRDALESGKTGEAEKLARDLFLDKKSEEHVLAWAASVLFERGVHSAIDLLESFINRFPDSLQLPRVYLADILSRASRFDQSTDQARYYLRQAMEAGAFGEPSKSRIIQEGISRSFLLLTSAYTTLGARTYSMRVLNYALQQELPAKWQEILNNELATLAQELRKEENHELDKKWESFFSSGDGADELYGMCEKNGFPLMAKRVDLLEGNFRFNAGFKLDTREILMLALQSDKQEYVLV
jgi:hypothetical protein